MPADPDLQASVVTDDPFSAIIGETVIRRVDLVVIGAPGKHRYADNFMGTTAECVIRFCDRPVLMVKRASEGPYRRVLVAFDGSEGAIRALHTALAIAPGAEFRVVHAWWPPRGSLGGSDAARQAIGEENDRLKALLVMGTYSQGRLRQLLPSGNWRAPACGDSLRRPGVAALMDR